MASDVVRLAVTGLSHAGKTVFITSLIENLMKATICCQEPINLRKRWNPPLPQSRPFEKPCCDRVVRTCRTHFEVFQCFLSPPKPLV